MELILVSLLTARGREAPNLSWEPTNGVNT
jgi:hypothetical protein